jgi:hypothetical protein
MYITKPASIIKKYIIYMICNTTPEIKSNMPLQISTNVIYGKKYDQLAFNVSSILLHTFVTPFFPKNIKRKGVIRAYITISNGDKIKYKNT